MPSTRFDPFFCTSSLFFISAKTNITSSLASDTEPPFRGSFSSLGSDIKDANRFSSPEISFSLVYSSDFWVPRNDVEVFMLTIIYKVPL